MDLDGSSPPSRPHKSVLVTRLCGSSSGFRFHVSWILTFRMFIGALDFESCARSASVLSFMDHGYLSVVQNASRPPVDLHRVARSLRGCLENGCRKLYLVQRLSFHSRYGPDLLRQAVGGRAPLLGNSVPVGGRRDTRGILLTTSAEVVRGATHSGR